MNKIARVTAVFWAMKILATTLGETGGDLLSMTVDLGYLLSTLFFFGLFLVSATAQVRSQRFYPPLYWTVILTTSTAGTTMSDFMDRTLELGYAQGSLILVTALVLVLAVWRAVEGTLSVNDIHTKRAELFYWAAILVSNTLGTALGDFLADDSGLGFLGGALLIGGLLVAVMLAWRFTKLSRVTLFWIAFVLTRPFGATFGDLMTKTQEKGGLGIGTVGASLVLAVPLVMLIYVTNRRERRLPPGTESPA